LFIQIFIFGRKRFLLKEKFGLGPHPIEQPFVYHFLKMIARKNFLAENGFYKANFQLNKLT